MSTAQKQNPSPPVKFKPGQLVLNPKLGLGKVLSVNATTVSVFFRDQPNNPRTIHIRVVPMTLAPEQSDASLDQIDQAGRRIRVPRTPKPAAKKTRGKKQ